MFTYSKLYSEMDIYNIGLNYKINYDQAFKNEKEWYIFVRGIFDKIGSITSKTFLNSQLICSLDFKNYKKEDIQNILNKTINNLKYEINENFINIYNYNAFDFLSKIYDNSDARYRNEELYKKYIKWATFGLDNKIPGCKFLKVEENAIIPSKERASDVGLDLTIISKVKDISKKTAMYDTGIIVAPDFGYYTKIVPRSSIIKSGYMLTNSIGIIDNTYRGSLKICLTKIDDSLPDLTLPFKCCQLIIDRSIHYTAEEVCSMEKLGDTSRGEGGFGSTDKK
jgi:dUTP pyrophosphatase